MDQFLGGGFAIAACDGDEGYIELLAVKLCQCLQGACNTSSTRIDIGMWFKGGSSTTA